MTRVAVTGSLLLAALWLGACATASTCASVPIVVAAKERRTRMLAEPGGLKTTETGQVREATREAFVPEYWLKDSQGHWDKVSEATWTAAEVGGRAEVCR